MADQPEALRLADFLDDQYDPSHNLEEAAAELRRLHDETLMLEGGYESACKILSEQDKKLAELEAVNQELLAALNNIEVSTHDAMTAALARAAIAKAERNKP
jgi:Tfp pilus assembly PilM family ATPase